MWQGTRRIVAASVIAAAAGSLARLLHLRWAPELHPRLVGFPVLAVFGATYLLAAWWMGSAEAARWLRLRVRGGNAPHGGTE